MFNQGLVGSPGLTGRSLSSSYYHHIHRHHHHHHHHHYNDHHHYHNLCSLRFGWFTGFDWEELREGELQAPPIPRGNNHSDDNHGPGHDDHGHGHHADDHDDRHCHYDQDHGHDDHASTRYSTFIMVMMIMMIKIVIV